MRRWGAHRCRLDGGRCLDGGRFAEREVGGVGSGEEGEGDDRLFGGGRGGMSVTPLLPGRS